MSAVVRTNKVYVIFFHESYSMWRPKWNMEGNCGFLFEKNGCFHVFTCDSREANKCFLHFSNVSAAGDDMVLHKSIAKRDVWAYMISDNDATTSKCWETCMACANVSKGFNAYDFSLSSFVPFYHPRPDRDIFSAPTLHSSQAVILILRCCLEAGHPVADLVGNLNARGTLPTHLCEIFSSVGRMYTMKYLEQNLSL